MLSFEFSARSGEGKLIAMRLYTLALVIHYLWNALWMLGENALQL